MASIFKSITKASIYLLVFLLPLFFLPLSLEAFEFNKQYLLFFLVSLAFFSWIVKMVLVDKELKFKKTPLDIFIGVFLLIAILSAVFSVDKGSSIFGYYGRFSDGLIGLINLALLYFLITNNLTAENRIMRTFSWSGFFVILLSYLSIFGVLGKLSNYLSMISDKLTFTLPAVMTGIGFNPTAGAMEGLAVFLAVFTVFLVGRILLEAKGKLSLIINYLLLIASLVLLIIIDFAAAWIILLVSLALFVATALWKKMFKERVGKLMLPMLLMIIGGLFIVVNIDTLISADLFADLRGLPKEEILDQGMSWKIGFGAATNDVKNGFLGTGIGTFFYDFSRYKPVEFNQSGLWQVRFSKPGNHISEVLGTAGFLGVLSYLALIVMFLLISLILLQIATPKLQIPKSKSQTPKQSLRDATGQANSKQIPLLLGFLALLVGQFVFYQNTTLAMMFWLFLALSVVSWEKPVQEKTFSLNKFPELSLIAAVVLIVIGLGILGTYYIGQNIFRADMVYAQSQKMALGPERTALIEKAVEMNPYFVQYQTILARAYLNEAMEEIRKPLDQQDSTALQAAVTKAIDTAKKTTELGPDQVANWETLGMIYRDIRTVASGAAEWGIKSFREAIELEPTNPVLHTELGKLLTISDIEEAKKEFEKGKELKPDYLDAQIQSILIYEKEESLAEAIRKMEDLSLEYPFSPEVLFQLGRLYFNAKRIDDAIGQLEKVINLMPNHSNAYYSLGVAYKEKGEKEKAIKAFEKVLELNPGNQDVQAKLDELKK